MFEGFEGLNLRIQGSEFEFQRSEGPTGKILKS